MAHRATGFAKKPPPVRSVRLHPARHGPPEDEPRLLTIPLNLVPLLVPYKKRGRLSLRIERLPQLARLSAGRNKGDGAWSLAPDELEDLEYFIPENVAEAHTLAIRIISLDGDAADTLALLDFLVSPHTGTVANDKDDNDAPAPRDEAELDRLRAELAAAKAALAAREAAHQIEVANAPPRDDGELERMREELAGAKTALAARESELAEVLKRAEPIAPESAGEAPDLDEVRETFKAEADERIAAAAARAAKEIKRARTALQAEADERVTAATVQAASDLKRARATWQAETDEQLAVASAAAASEFARAREAWQAEAGKRSAKTDPTKQLALARERWQKEMQEALAKAEEVWKAGEAVRRAVAEAQWQEKSVKALAEARKAADTEWQKKLASALADARAETTASLNQDSAEALRGLRETIAALEARVAQRDAALVKAAEDATKASERLHREAKGALAEAELAWRANEAARLAGTEAQWKEDAARELAAMAALRDQAEATVESMRRENDAAAAAARDQAEVELSGLRDTVAALEARIKEREAAFLKANEDAVRAREQVQRDAADALAAAEAAWKAETEARFAAADSEWNEKSAHERAAATARHDETEAALAKVRGEIAEAVAAARIESEQEVGRLTQSVWALEAVLTERNTMLDARAAELAQAKREAERDHLTLQQEAASVLAKAKTEWKADVAEKLAAAEAQWTRRHMVELNVATGRYESAEAALAQQRIRNNAAREHSDADFVRLQHEREALQASLAAAEGELAKMRSGGSLNDTPATPGKIRLRSNAEFEAADRERGGMSRNVRRAIGGFAVAAMLAGAGIWLYPTVFGGSHAPAARHGTAAAVDSEAEAEAVAAEQTAVVVHDAKLRARPSTAAASASTLRRGAEVTVLERRGNWTRVRAAGTNAAGTPREGWVYASLLKDSGPPAEPASSE